MKRLLFLICTVFVSVSMSAGDGFPRKIVLEEATGTWCGYCVYGIESIKLMQEQYPDNFIAIGLHDGDAMGNVLENYSSITNTFTSYPGGLYNRTENQYPDVYRIQNCIEKYKNSAIAKIEASATYDDSEQTSVKVATNITFLYDNEAANYKIAYVVVEDQVGPYSQRNFLSGDASISSTSYMYVWAQRDNPYSMQFNDVARGIYPEVNGLTGSVPSVIKKDQVYNYSYTFDLPNNIQNKANIRIVTLLIDNESGEILNADETSIGEENEEEGEKEVIKISSAGQTTWCSAYDLDFTGVNGLKAYTATGYHRTKGTIWLTRVYEVPAEEGILLIGDQGEYKIPQKATTAYYANLMVGTLKAITINETDGEYTNYYLSNGAYGVGFYKVDGSVDIKANRAYLPLLKNTVSGSRGFIGIDYDDDAEGTTGISNNNREPITNNVWYNLQGQRVDNPSKGLYIKNGKKVLVK